MKLVINKTWGGFNLSPLAIQEFLKRKGKSVFFYKQNKHSFRDGKDEYVKIPTSDATWTDYSLLNDIGNKVSSLEGAEWFDDKNISRHDPDLISIVEELGDLANTSVSNLRIVEIPDGVEYEIDDYDGMESIHESHRSWG